MVFKFTIDKWANRWVPRNRVAQLPTPIAWVLGHHRTKPQPDYFIWLEILVGTFCGMALLEGLFSSHTAFTQYHVPMVIASYGATAILCFNASQVPLAQPRNIFMGHFVGSLLGLCVQKLFFLGSGARANMWASGALSVAVASVAMSVLNCVHPPAGASALLPSIDDRIREMGWWYLPVQIVSSLLIICVAMITGNVVRRYPVFWWSPEATGSAARSPVEFTPAKSASTKSSKNVVEDTITVTGNTLLVPEQLQLDEVEIEFLETLQAKLREAESFEPTPATA
ncbi:hypothetical protein DICA1_F38864 [Diutina catenulata]